MVTAVTSFGRSGLSDWLVQRVSGVILLAYFLFMGYAVATGGDYASWKALFAQTWVKVFSLMALLSLAAHAWIGLWSVLTDYLTERLMGTTGNVLRITLQILIVLVLFVYVVWGVQILWGY
ncbi:succinate dehydrogenase, hydrophobic membrane anchor protein [Parahaliea mediterranea]|uniref:Succinate dehydrogenase hydrophobic membrane anchor subunit n=1 Tax=Parahaliea mediterranea TaxID=651086 RepID=A0A939DIR4_9GAMM|nr:succinate dehydrogenase, hydrophobic membrane anchor protein [Parahaliea mediterranea]MBN7798880.1 succinate dehydrogenase, hydrophobic membrane anchor protein [Parahaliea mediterranea]